MSVARIFSASRFLTDRDTARTRASLALLAATSLAGMAWLTWWSGFDFRLRDIVSTSSLVQTGHAAFDMYSEFGPFLLYLPFLVILGIGLKSGPPLLRNIGVSYLTAQFLGAFLLTRLLKLSVARPRPYAGSEMAAGFIRDLHSSFPSSHTADVSIGAFFVLLLVRARGIRAFALSLAVLMACARLALEKHYLSDVLAGLAIGAATAALLVRGYLVPRWGHGDANT